MGNEVSDKECSVFHWVGQPVTSCDQCSRPAWEHAGMAKSDGVLFSSGWICKPWDARTIGRWLTDDVITTNRAAELLLAIQGES